MKRTTYTKAWALAVVAMILGACGDEGGAGDSDANSSASIAPTPPSASALPRVDFAILTNFPYEVKWETDGKQPDPATFAQRVPAVARGLHGQRVAVDGYMIPISLSENDTKTTEFLILPDPKACCEGKTPKQNGWILVNAPSSGVAPLMDQLLRVSGQLAVKEIWDPADGFFKGLYHMSCEEVAPVAL